MITEITQIDIDTEAGVRAIQIIGKLMSVHPDMHPNVILNLYGYDNLPEVAKIHHLELKEKIVN